MPSPTATEPPAANAAAKSAQASGEEAAQSLGREPLKQIIVAVHGMGDEVVQDTIQSTYAVFARYFGYRPAAMPLGRFHFSGGSIQPFRLLSPPDPAPPAALKATGFIEVYWADIPRRLQRRGYVIEDSKAWARTLIERVRARAHESRQKAGTSAAAVQRTLEVEKARGQQRTRGGAAKVRPIIPPPSDADLLAAGDALEELLETIQVLGRLLFLAEKAGLGHFDLDNLLTAYLGDVQVVAEFENYRDRILAQFHGVLAGVHKVHPEAEIHVLAHSEGSVVAFLGLLRGLCGLPPMLPGLGQPNPILRPAWVEQVRGLMTFGSPIDKHLVLWPEIWPHVAPTRTRPGAYPSLSSREVKIDIGPPAKYGPICWHNYYDYGDPVGYQLDTAHDWLRDHLPDCFEPEAPHDHGFGRYFLPGKAHIDYWEDVAVFGHFIQEVIGLPAPGNRAYPEPEERRWCRLGANVVPYVLSALLLVTAVYILWRALGPYLPTPNPPLWPLVFGPAGGGPPVGNLYLANQAAGGAESLWSVPRNVLGISCLLAGLTVASRILRLTRNGWWTGWALGLFALFAAGYCLLVEPVLRDELGFKGWLRHLAPTWIGFPGIVGRLAPTALTLFLAWSIIGLSLWGRSKFGGRNSDP